MQSAQAKSTIIRIQPFNFLIQPIRIEYVVVGQRAQSRAQVKRALPALRREKIQLRTSISR